MTYSITQFENNTSNQLSALDGNFTTFGALVPIPCSVAGTNTLTLTQSPANMVPTPTLTQYTTNNIFTGVAVATNTGAVSATVGSLGSLPVYKDTGAGPVALSGGEIVANCAFSLRYDAALNSGAGGFHLFSTTQNANSPITPSSVQIGGGATITMVLSGSVSMSFSALAGTDSQDVTFTLTGLPPKIPLVGDFVRVVPPSLPGTGAAFWGMVTAVGSLNSTSSVSTINIRELNAFNASVSAVSGYFHWTSERVVP